MRFKSEMDALDRKIGGKQQVIGGAARAVDRAVIANACNNGGSGRESRAASQPVRDRLLAKHYQERMPKSNIREVLDITRALCDTSSRSTHGIG